MGQPDERAEFGRYYTESFDGFLREVEGETDRAAVILASARLDDGLGELLRRSMKPQRGTTNVDEPLKGDPLLGQERPLGSFGSRIEACYRLGLIDEGLRAALDLVRSIRNSYAHKWQGCSLSAGSVSDRARSLVGMHANSKMFQGYRDVSVYRNRAGHPELAWEFRLVVAALMLRLEWHLKRPDQKMEPLTTPHMVTLLPD